MQFKKAKLLILSAVLIFLNTLANKAVFGDSGTNTFQERFIDQAYRDSTTTTADWGYQALTLRLPASSISSQSSFAMARDNSGNIIFVWNDDREGQANIYAAKYNSSGIKIMQDKKIASGTYPKVACDISNNIYIAFNPPGGGLYVQKVGTNGNNLLLSQRVDSVTMPAEAGAHDIAIDSSNNSYVAYTIYGPYGANAAITKLNSSGTVVWGQKSANTNNSGSDRAYDVSVATAGGYLYVAHRDSYPGSLDVCRINPSTGAKVLGSDFLIDNGFKIRIAAESNGNFCVVYTDNGSVYYKKYNPSNILLRGPIVIAAGEMYLNKKDPEIAIDSSNNKYIIWTDRFAGPYGYDVRIRAQKLSASDVAQWPDTGVQLCHDDLIEEFLPQVRPTAGAGLFAIWGDYKFNNYNIYANIISSSGSRISADDFCIHNAPEYLATASGQSLTIDTVPEIVTAAALNYNTVDSDTHGMSPTLNVFGQNYSLFGQAAEFYLTNNGGVNWYQVTPGVKFTFPVNSSDLRFRVVLNTNNRSVQPCIEDITITYDYSGTLVDTTPPTGTVSINNGATTANSAYVTLNLASVDAESGMGPGALMIFSNDNIHWSEPEAYAATKAWVIMPGNGNKTVYVKYQDAAGNWSPPYSDTINLDAFHLYETAYPYIKYFLDRALSEASGFTGLTKSFQLYLGGDTPEDENMINYGAASYDQSILGRICLENGSMTILNTYSLYFRQYLYDPNNPLINNNGDFYDAGNIALLHGPYRIIRVSDRNIDGWWNTWDWHVDTGAASCLIIYALDAFQRNPSEFLDYRELANLFGEYLLRLQDSDGGIRYGPRGMYHPAGPDFYWNLKSTEQNEQAINAFQLLYQVIGDDRYNQAVQSLKGWFKNMYDLNAHLYHTATMYNGQEWVKVGIGSIASDVIAFAPIDLMFSDSYFGATQAERDSEVDSMFTEAEQLMAFLDEENQPKLFRFSTLQNGEYGTVEWSAQMALGYLRAAQLYFSMGNTEKVQFYMAKYNCLVRNLDNFFMPADDDAQSRIAPYASYLNGGVAGGVATGIGNITYNCKAALASAYYAFAKEGFDPTKLGGGLGIPPQQDTTEPSCPVVTDQGISTFSTNTLSASWSCSDPQTDIVEYRYRIIRDSINGTIIKDWASSGRNNFITVNGLNLQGGKTYFFTVQARNGAGLLSDIGYSDGITVNNPPSVGTISPVSGSSAVNKTVTFTTTYTDPNGWANIQSAMFMINTSTIGINCFLGYYNQNTNKLYLRNDTNTDWLGGFAPGSSKTIENSYVKVNCLNTKVSGSGNTLTVTWSLIFKSAFAARGVKNTYLYVIDDYDSSSGWVQVGTYLIGPNSSPLVGTDPINGSSVINTFVPITTTYSDPNGWQDIQYVQFIINTSTSGSRCFYGYYDQNKNKLYLRNDAGSAWLGVGFAPGSNNSIENAYCKLDCSQTTVQPQPDGTTLKINWGLTFKSTFTGTKNTYLYIKDDTGSYNGWSKKGTWIIRAQ